MDGPAGKYATSGDWRYIIFNNLALLDAPGEFVCTDNGDGTSDFSYIPPVGDENTPVVVSQLKTLIDMSKVTGARFNGINSCLSFDPSFGSRCQIEKDICTESCSQ